MTSKPVTWAELNKQLRHIKDIQTVMVMFSEEKSQLARPKWLKRIWSRYRFLRTQREKKEMNL